MKKKSVKLCWMLVPAVFALVLFVGGALADQGKVTQLPNGVSSYAPTGMNGAIDFKNAKAFPLPISNIAPNAPYEVLGEVAYPGAPGFVPGATGSGKMNTQILFDPNTPSAPASFESDETVEPQEFGTQNHPFTTSRVDVLSTTNAVSKLYPFRAAGKLYFKKGTANYVCSASLIKKGLLVTAAHCVADFGKNTWHNTYVYAPALWGATAPYGTWQGLKAYALTAYLNGTDPCAAGASGVVCRDDVAVIVLKAHTAAPLYPGTVTGWFGYGWNGWGFTTTTPKLTLINQLGYPVSHDGGLKMQRTDSQGYVSTTMANNTVWGTRQTGGSSGGPELNNLGAAAALSGTTGGSYYSYNIVVGVTSWGYTSAALKEQGASPFLSGNIAALVSAACTAYPAACAP
jgi:V8-like Glu-specific endopeptidase